MDLSFDSDIRPKFRDGDVVCMGRSQVNLSDATWMCDPRGGASFADHANARRVYSALSRGIMPPDEPWSSEWLATYRAWMNLGFPP
jgi:hypothetical protein